MQVLHFLCRQNSKTHLSSTNHRKLTLPYLTLPLGWAGLPGCYTCPAL